MIYRIENDKVESYTITQSFNKLENWTKALKYMLCNLKWVLYWFVGNTNFQPLSSMASSQSDVPIPAIRSLYKNASTWSNLYLADLKKMISFFFSFIVYNKTRYFHFFHHPPPPLYIKHYSDVWWTFELLHRNSWIHTSKNKNCSILIVLIFLNVEISLFI